jgi:hypothetical protein
MTAILLALFVQNDGLPFEATVRVERWTRTEDRIAASSARLRVRPGRALEWVEGRTRLVIRPGRFHPAELWLYDWAELRRRFDVSREREDAALPAGVTAPDGSLRAPVKVELRGAAIAGGAEKERIAFRLVPRDEALRRRLPWVRAFADPETLRIERAIFHSPLQVTVMTLDGFREAGSTDDPAFEFEESGVPQEER